MTPTQHAFFDKADVEIARQAEWHGPYTHNILSCILRSVADKCGDDEADKLVKKHRLTDRYKIHPAKKGATP